MGQKKSASTSSLAGRPTHAQSAYLEKRLRQAAVDVFLDCGFEGTSMEAVARAAGISKPTLYARYTDKNALFSDVVVWATTLYHAPIIPQDIANWDLATGLGVIARSTLQRALDPAISRLNKFIITEAARIPSSVTNVYSTLWSPRIKAVADLLAAHKKAGNVVVKNVEVAAELFLSMVAQRPTWMALQGATRPLEMEEEHMQQGIELFLAAIQPHSAIDKHSRKKKNLQSALKKASVIKRAKKTK